LPPRPCGAAGRCARLEREVSEALAALSRLQAELTEAQAGERRARHRAAHDPLTALLNRGSFCERLDERLRESTSSAPELALLFLDLDGFKSVNDQHGHGAGDALLRIVAARLSRAVRVDDVVGRLGGDEFACLIAGVHDRKALGRVADKLFYAVSAPMTIGTIELTVRPSIGIALYPGDGSTAELLLRRADMAMYRAKRLRCNHAFFERCAEA
jgi:diguanylate cyclase (GGDEF)-like protein